MIEHDCAELVPVMVDAFMKGGDKPDPITEILWHWNHVRLLSPSSGSQC